MEEIKQSFINKAKKDKFLLIFDVPPILKKISSAYTRDINTIIPDSVQFSVFGTMVPGITVKAKETRYAGSTLYVSTHSKDSYPPVEIKFTVDSLYNNWWTIYKWLNLLHDEKTGTYNAQHIEFDKNFNDYQTNLTIFALDEYDNKRMKFTYTKAFPTDIAPLEYDYQNEGDQQLMSGFTFVYSQLHVEPLSQNLFNVMP